MKTIDADAHVVETERTWDYMDPSDSHFRPVVVTMPDASGKPGAYWLIDGQVRNFARKSSNGGEARDAAEDAEETVAFARVSGKNAVVSVASRDLVDVEQRLRHMDQLGTDVQVLYPTLFLSRVADRPEVEVALCRGYNRWMADVWRRGKGRLRWAAVLPFSVMDEALKELRTAVQNGACAANVRPVEGDWTPSHPHFFPLYEEASRLNVPIALHIGNSNVAMREVLSDSFLGITGTFSYYRLMSVSAFHRLIMKGIPAMFPNLRFGFLEAGAQWVPFAIHDLKRRFENQGKKLKEDVMRESRIYVACQTDDDIPYVLKYAGEENLLLGTDYGHADQSSELEALQIFRREGGIPAKAREKILDDNPRAFYNL